jgi:hypothetical protein
MSDGTGLAGITDVELSKEVQARVGEAVAQAGASPLAEIAPIRAITVPTGVASLSRQRS